MRKAPSRPTRTTRSWPKKRGRSKRKVLSRSPAKTSKKPEEAADSSSSKDSKSKSSATASTQSWANIDFGKLGFPFLLLVVAIFFYLFNYLNKADQEKKDKLAAEKTKKDKKKSK